MCVVVPNVIKIGQTVAEIWRCNVFFSKWRQSATLGLLGAYWDHAYDDHLMGSIVVRFRDILFFCNSLSRLRQHYLAAVCG